MKVTYKPRDGDPASVVWCGVKFEANLPKETNQPEIVALAGSNPWFVCEGKDIDAKAQVAKTAPKVAKAPKTPEEYRAYAIEWLKAAQPDPEIAAKDADRASLACAKSIETRYAAEEPLREKCGWGTDDDALLQTIFYPKLATLKGERGSGS